MLKAQTLAAFYRQIAAESEPAEALKHVQAVIADLRKLEVELAWKAYPPVMGVGEALLNKRHKVVAHISRLEWDGDKWRYFAQSVLGGSEYEVVP